MPGIIHRNTRFSKFVLRQDYPNYRTAREPPVGSVQGVHRGSATDATSSPKSLRTVTMSALNGKSNHESPSATKVHVIGLLLLTWARLFSLTSRGKRQEQVRQMNDVSIIGGRCRFLLFRVHPIFIRRLLYTTKKTGCQSIVHLCSQKAFK